MERTRVRGPEDQGETRGSCIVHTLSPTSACTAPGAGVATGTRLLGKAVYLIAQPESSWGWDPRLHPGILTSGGVRGVVDMASLLPSTLAVSFLQAHIRFKPTVSQQQKSVEQQDTVVDGSFIVRYDVNRTLSGGSIQVSGLQRAE